MTDQIDIEETAGSGVTRRRLLQRAGVVGVVAWTAPTVMSLRSSASAASGTPLCPNCNTSYGGAGGGCGGPGGCSDGSGGFCDTTVEGPCTCDVAGYIAGSEGCTSSASCAGTYGAGVVCIHADSVGANVCISQCNGAAGPNTASAKKKVQIVNGRRASSHRLSRRS